MDSRISATEAARSFSELLNRVRYRGESFVVERGGEPVCRITPARPVRFTVRELVGVLRSGAHPDEGFLDELEVLTRSQPTLGGDPWES